MVEILENNQADTVKATADQYRAPIGPKTPLEVPGIGSVYATPQSQSYKDHKTSETKAAQAAAAKVTAGNSGTAQLSGDFIKGVEKTERHLNNSVADLNKLGKKEEAAALLRLNERLGDARVHHANPAEHNMNVEAAKENLLKIHKEAAEKAKEAKAQVKTLKWQNRGNKFGKVVRSKLFIVPAAVVGAITAAAMFSSKRAKQERAEEVAGREQKTQEMREDVAALRAVQNGQNTLMGIPPTPGDHAARVLSARNGAAAGIDTSNPALNMNYDVVRS